MSLDTLKSEIASLTAIPLVKTIGPGSGDAPVDLLKSHINSYTKTNGTVVQAHEDKRSKKVKSVSGGPASVPPIHAHTDKIRALAEERKGNGTEDHEQMRTIAEHLDKGDHEAAAATLKHMDTEPRDAVLDHIHPEHREKLGFSNIDKEKNIAKFEKDHPAEKKVVLKKKPKNDPEAARAAGEEVRAAIEKNSAEKKAAGKPEGFEPRTDVSGDDDGLTDGDRDAIEQAKELRAKHEAKQAAAGKASPHGDANEKDWDKLPDEENPKHALSAFSSSNLGKVARGDADLNDYAHQELANRGLDSEGNWVGFKQAAEHHKDAIAKIAGHKAPGAFNGYGPNEEEDDRDTLSMLHSKVLSASAKGHLDLNKRAKATLADRGHDSNGKWVGFDKAKEHHFPAEKKPLAKSEDDSNDEDLAKNLTGVDLLKAHISAYTKKDKP